VIKDNSGVKEVEMVSKLTKVPHIRLPIKAAQLRHAEAVKKRGNLIKHSNVQW
jgi:hypothetical protein